MTDVIIIGGGPAGLTAAVYVVRSGLSAIVFEELMCGGQTVNTPEIENYPSVKTISGWEFAQNLQQQVEALGAEIIYEKVSAVIPTENGHRVITDGGNYEARTVIIANGVKRRKLDIPGEEELAGRGVSYCATCDGAFYRGKVTAVIGGGNTALEDALFLSDLCEKVYLIHRRDEFRGEKHLVDALRKKQNVEFVTPAVPVKILGNDKVTGIVVKKPNGGTEKIIETDGVFAAVGLSPENAPFAEVVELDKSGYIKADESCRTSADGIFAAGDTRTKALRQIVTAVSDGAGAAINAAGYIHELDK